jgi:hypothetical protein
VPGVAARFSGAPTGPYGGEPVPTISRVFDFFAPEHPQKQIFGENKGRNWIPQHQNRGAPFFQP